MHIVPARRDLALALGLILTLPAPLMAQSMAQTADPGPSPDAGDPDQGPAIVVTGHALRDMNLMAGSVEIAGDDLIREMSPQIGDVLAKLPGVSATSFAPGASRPVLRGLSGERVMVLVDGLGTIDAAGVSDDHGVALDMLTIDHIDVLHGPAVLAYGGQAIGGAVVAYDKRIPRVVPEQPIALNAIASYNSATRGPSLAGALDARLGQDFVAHVDASWFDGGDLDIGGDQLSPQLKSQVLGEAADLRAQGDSAGAESLESTAAQRGRIPNSFARGTSFGAGVAWIGAESNLGVSVQRMDRRYGVPSRPGPDAEENVSIDLGQTRFDLRGELGLSGAFKTLRLRAAWADYRHDELEDGEVGTTFARKGGEARLELVQADRGGWKGQSGLQLSSGKLTPSGEEAILPENSDTRAGLFTLQSLRLGAFDVEAAGRAEHVSIEAQSAGFDRGFTLWGGAAGLTWRASDAFKLGLNFTHGERAPAAEELLSNGAHIATQSFEIGDPTFGKERSNNLEAFIKFETDDTRLSLTAYHTDFAGFITPVADGTTIDDLPVYRYRQLPATFRGFEAQASQALAHWGDGKLSIDAAGDYVHAELDDVGPAPRIPPLRLSGGLEYAAKDLSLRGEVEWNAAQNRVSSNENPTSAFTLVNASATWRPLGASGPLTVIASADNIFDAIGRRAASFTRDFVPIAGRSLRLTGNVVF